MQMGVDHEPQQDKPRTGPDIEALRLAAFATMMQHGDGLMAKAPDYMLKKWGQISRCATAEQMMGLMDDENLERFAHWAYAWTKKGAG